jgi:hypothetical protein
MDDATSVNMQITIMSMDDSASGTPSKTFASTGVISENDPAGRRYKQTFFRLTNASRPNCTAAGMDENLKAAYNIQQRPRGFQQRASSIR